jgi:hypothetical protein
VCDAGGRFPPPLGKCAVPPEVNAGSKRKGPKPLGPFSSIHIFWIFRTRSALSLEKAGSPHLTSVAVVAIGAMLDLPVFVMLTVEKLGKPLIEIVRSGMKSFMQVFVFHSRLPPIFRVFPLKLILLKKKSRFPISPPFCAACTLSPLSFILKVGCTVEAGLPDNFS